MTITDAEFLDALCRERFDAFAQKAFGVINPSTPYEWNWHIGCIAEHLEAVYNGEIKRIIINLPPRSLKSYLVSSAFAAWVLGKKPSTKFINTGYGETVVEANARNCRAIMRDVWYQKLFPGTRIGELDRLMHFETTAKGQYYAATALSPITGVGCEYMQIDDPIKPMEAVSDQVRTQTNNNVRTTLMNRFDDRRIAKLMVVMQRSHFDDLTANLARDGGYLVLKLPAENIGEKSITYSLNNKTWEMEPNGLLFPQRLSREELARIRLDMTEYNYVGQYLQEPVPIGGGEFKDDWMQFYAPGSIKPKEMNIAIIVDQAGGEELNKKKKKLSDWTVIMVIGLAPDNNYYVLDIIRDRFNPTERIETIFMVHRKWNALAGKPPKVGCEQIGLMTDAHYLKIKQQQDAYHFPIVPLGAGQRISKEERIRKLIPVMQNMRWYMPPSHIYVDGTTEARRWDLTREFIDSELKTFPRSRYDDMIDAASRILDEELAMVFPKPKVGTVAKARQAAMSGGGGSWEDY